MNEASVTSALVPIALMLIMLALGLSLDRADFLRVMRSRSALAAGLVGQLVLLPVLGLVVARGSGLEATFAIGLVVLALCPGGALSNAVCAVARADLALSVTLTACSSLVVPFTLPLFYGWASRLWAPAVPALTLPVLPTIVRLLSITVVPVAVGMVARARYPRMAARFDRAARMLAGSLFIVVVATIVIQNADALTGGFSRLGGPLLALGLGATSLGLGIGALLGLPRAASVTLGIEVGMQNLATATFVTVSLLGDVRMALVPAAYAFVMLPAAGVLALVSRAGRRRHDHHQAGDDRETSTSTGGFDTPAP